MTCPPPYTGPRLARLEDFGAWKDVFLAAAGSLGDYYVVDGYVDTEAANSIGPAKMHQFHAAADAAFSDIPTDLSHKAYDAAVVLRKRQVRNHVRAAIERDVASKHETAVRRACQRLLAAVAPPLHHVFKEMTSPFAMWAKLDVASRRGLAELWRTFVPVLDRPRSVAEARAAIDVFLNALFSAPTRATRDSPMDEVAEVRAKLTMLLLTHATDARAMDLFQHDSWSVPEYEAALHALAAEAPPLALAGPPIVAVPTPEPWRGLDAIKFPPT
ncbi:hypothetical protein ACHHYP_13025 [Achlya hypogyna]|uniref:Uncharacterized protein n=1 Tax=Achlya hypogyna TaxID=1202772 RepID=A0A1V9YG62_ACHHY|nr:hypothetical protein ACHHYP_13025 [Achlya hypogyna]